MRRERKVDALTSNKQAEYQAAAIRPSRRWERSEHPYTGLVAILATKHGKIPLIAPPLERDIGLRVEAVAVDTDSLGTFTGDIPRQGSPLETAVAKARLGMDATGRALGLASEGSIGPHPAMPFVIADREIIVLVDDDNGIVVWEGYSSWDVVAAATSVEASSDLGEFLAEADFPNHQLIVRPNIGAVHPIHKGISSIEKLTAAIAECAAIANDGLARVENDLRAHACPSRQVVIAAAAERLAVRLASRCPACGAPGWGRIDVLLGVPCAWCGTEVTRPRAEIDGCPACEHRETRPVVSPDDLADPGECSNCNP